MGKQARGNPQWRRAAEERRQAHIVSIADDDDEEHIKMADADTTEQHPAMDLMAPMVGALASGFITSKAPEFGIPALHAGLATVAGSVLIALSCDGPVRQMAISAAAHAAANEVIRWNQKAAAPQPSLPAVEKPSTTEYVTKAELIEVVNQLVAANQKANLETQQRLVRELGPLLQEAIQSSARDAAAQNQSSRDPVPAPRAEHRTVSAPRQIDEVYALLAPDEQQAVAERFKQMSASECERFLLELAQLTPREGAAYLRDAFLSPSRSTADSDSAIVDENKVDRIHAIYMALNDDERPALSQMIAAMPKAESDKATDQLAKLPIETAVNTVREALRARHAA